jgi:threonine/homoserine/homoserine lactone efflux protein
MDSHGPAIAAYTWATLALVLTPGATTATVVRQAMHGGFRAGTATAAGAAVANTTHAIAAGLGLAMLIVRIPAVLMTVRLAGAAYLAWLGLRSLWRAWRAQSFADRVAASASPEPGLRSGFMDGLIVNLLNPAIATFYLVVVPSFLGSDRSWGTYAGMAAIHVGLAFVCHLVWSGVFDRVRAAAGSGRVIRALDVLAGAALLALAWRTAAAI